MNYYRNMFKNEYDCDSRIYHVDPDARYSGYDSLGEDGYYNLFGVDSGRF